MNKIIANKNLFLIILLITGCSTTEPVTKANTNATTNNVVDVGCPEQPKLELEQKNVREISLDNQTVNQSSQVNRTKTLGYTFPAKAGQKLSYRTDDDICIWVYAPDTELVSGTKLPATGKYTLQVAALKGSTTFDLEIGLNSLQTSSSNDKTVSKANSSPPKQSQTLEKRSPADSFVRQYYLDINNRDYESSWNKLSPEFKRQTSGYFDYQKWWNSVSNVRIGEIKLINQSQNTAVVDAELGYVMNSGEYFVDSKNYIYLVWNSNSNTWLFRDKK